jgi:hypothetical protein
MALGGGGGGSGGLIGGLGLRRGSIESILSEDDLRSLLKRREKGNGAGSVTGTEDETTDFEGDVDDGMVIDGGEAEQELRAARREEPKVATPMGLAGAEGQDE